MKTLTKPYQKTTEPSAWKDLLLLTFLFSLLFFTYLGNRPLQIPDEGRYAEIIREMLLTHDYVTPHIDGIKYFEKPVLFYWLGVAASHILSLSIWSLRSVNAFLGLIGCLLTYGMARHLYGRTAGLLAGLILATNIHYFAMLHVINLDLTVTVFLSLSLYAFLLSMQQASGFIKLTATLIGFTGAALAVMTKGLIGILFPLAIIGLWIACFQTRFPFKKSHLFVGSCLFFIIVTPWHVLAGARNPGFYYFYFIEQHFLRYTIKSVGHYQPIWFFIPCLLIGFFPWIVFLPQAIKDSIPTTWQQRTQRQTEMYFLIWSVVIFLFFSFSKSKLTPYILPIFPPLAILTGRYLASHMTDPHKMRLGFYLLPGMALVVASYLGIHAHQSSVGQTAIYFYWDAGIILFGSLLATYMGLCHQAKRGIIAIISIMLVFLLIAMKAFPGMDMRNTQQLSAVLKPLLNTHSVVATYEKYYQDLPFYLGRRVTIIGWTNELSFGIEHQDTHEWTLNQDDFISFWNKHPSAFVITQRSLYPEMQSRFPQVKLCLLAETSYDVLLGKCSSRKTI